MKYRAVVVNPNADRTEMPQQIVGNQVEALITWARNKAQELPSSVTVVVYKVTETDIYTVRGGKE